MNKKQSKYFNTAIKMDEALITLLDKKDLEYITISEICQQAGVNRSTFYLHYENISDLLEETTRYVLDKHLEYYSVKSRDVSLKYENLEKRELIFITSEYITPYLSFIKENQRLFRVAIKRFDSLSFDKLYQEMFTHIFSPILTRFLVPHKKHKYVMKFYLSGIFGIVVEWLDNNCADEVNEIVKIIIDCVMGDRSIDG